MITLTQIVAAAVVHSSTAALSHFGVTLQPAEVVQPPPAPAVERVVARSPHAPDKLDSCPKLRIRAGAFHA